MGMDSGPPRQRKTLNLKKRTEPAPDGAVVASEIKEEPKRVSVDHEPSPSKQTSQSSEAPARSGPKSDPFGGAIPCDENKIRDAEKRAEEKLARQQRSMEDSDRRDRDRGGYRDER